MVFEITDYFENTNIAVGGQFTNLGSAKESAQNNTLCYALTHEYLTIALNNPLISAVIIPPKLLLPGTDMMGKAIIVQDDAERSYSLLKNKLIGNGFLLPQMEFYIAKSAIIDPSTYISKKCYIGENVKIGRNCIIEDYTFINDNCIIGDNCTLGNEGLYFKRAQDQQLYKTLHSGGVYLDKNVEILNNSMIQRSHDASQLTSIGEGSKISINVNIGHSSKVGRHTLISGNVQISGRVVIGDYCWIGTSSTISDSVIIKDYAKIRIGSIVIKDVSERGEVSGNFAYDHTKHLKNFIKAKKC